MQAKTWGSLEKASLILSGEDCRTGKFRSILLSVVHPVVCVRESGAQGKEMTWKCAAGCLCCVSRATGSG